MGYWRQHRGITTVVEDSIHDQVRQLALEDGTTIAKWVRLLILDGVKQRMEQSNEAG